MKRLRDGGMTLLEVAFAISILLIGVTFVAKSDSVMYHYRNHRELRQQMLFYAAGQLERVLQNQLIIQGNLSGGDSALTNFQVDFIGPEVVNDHLEYIGIKVSVPQTTNSPDPVTLYSYRVKK